MTSSLKFIPPVIGHRGACAYAPENTLSSFVKAAQLNIKWVEFDVTTSSDGVPIIIHDDTLNRTTNGHGKVNHYPYSHLQFLDAGKWFNSVFSNERIPSLMTIINFLQDMNMFANIEIKTAHECEESLIKKIIKEMQPYLSQGNEKFLFSSFSTQALSLLRKYSPDCQLGLLLDDWAPDWKKTCMQLNCVSVHVNEKIITEKIAREIKAMGKFLLCYTVNDPARAKELFSYGVDAVFSDIPDKIK